MTNGDLNWITNYIWSIADDVLRDLYQRGKYRDVILPMTVMRRLDAVLEESKQAVLDMKSTLDAAGVIEQDAALRQAAGQTFYNVSPFTLRDLRSRANPQQLKETGLCNETQDLCGYFRVGVLAADKNIEHALEGLFSRHQSLGIRQISGYRCRRLL